LQLDRLELFHEKEDELSESISILEDDSEGDDAESSLFTLPQRVVELIQESKGILNVDVE